MGAYPAMINQNYLFHFFVTTNKDSNNIKINFKSENMLFTALQINRQAKRTLMRTYATHKVVINLK